MAEVEQRTCLIDEFGPVPVVQPASVAELGERVRQAGALGQAIYPLGGRTMLGIGLPPRKPGLGADMAGLAGVIEYPARDMTITVQAGITLARLQELLRAENQRLPIDVPCSARATLGGVLAADTSGLRRYGFGTLRDYVIGISVVNDLGEEVKAGGRVVKNVAGYDMCKLHIGALGTLGIITQVTLKLRPRSEEQALIAIGVGPDQLEKLLDHWQHSSTRPVCLDLINQAAARQVSQQSGIVLPEAPWILFVGFEENREAVAWQVQQLVRELPGGTVLGLDARVGSPAEPLWQALTEFPAPPPALSPGGRGQGEGEARLTFKANLLSRAAAAFCLKAEELSQGIQLQAHAGNGIVIGHLCGDVVLDQAAALLSALRDLACAAQGNLVILRCPPSWKSTLPVWGAPRGDLWLMRTIKEKLDPRQIFNAGRFLV